MVGTVDALMMQVHGDRGMHQIGAAREARDYERCHETAAKVLTSYKALAGLVRLERHNGPLDCDRKESARLQHLQLRRPKQAVQEFAALDGHRARTSAIAALQRRDYEAARAAFDEASTSFDWAGSQQGIPLAVASGAASAAPSAPGSLGGGGAGGSPVSTAGGGGALGRGLSLDKLERRIRVGEAANRGDSILEAIASALKPIYNKNFLELSEVRSSDDGSCCWVRVPRSPRPARCASTRGAPSLVLPF